MSQFDGEQSEDGELAQSPVDREMDFSLSSEDDDAGDGEGETGDSLDIKPPQAATRGRRDKRHRDRDRDRDRNRTAKHAYRDREPSKRVIEVVKHSDADLYYAAKDHYREKEYTREREIYKERESHRNRAHFRDKDYKEKDAYREIELYREKEIHREKDPYRSKESYRERELHREKDAYARDPHKEREKDGLHVRDRERAAKRPDADVSKNARKRSDLDKKRASPDDSKSRYVDEAAFKDLRRGEKENRDRPSGDKELEDLRTRLLSKRQTKERQDEPDKMDISPGERRPERREKRAERDSRKKMTETQVESSPDRDGSRLSSRLPELDKTQLERREKLLKTEREMSHRKKTSRAALVARREKLKESVAKRPYPSPPPSHRKRRRRSPPSPQTPSDVVTVSDASDTEVKDDITDRSDNSKEASEEGTGSSSGSSSESTDEESGSEEEEEEEEEEHEDDGENIHAKHSSQKYKEKEDLEGHVTAPTSPLQVDTVETSPASAHSETPTHGSYREDLSRSPSRSRSHSFSPPPAEENGSNSVPTVSVQPEEPVESSPPPPPDERDSLPPYLPAIQGCRSVEEFQCLNRIEEGTYGVVYRARDKTTDEIVALKRLKMEKEKEGFPITSLREINTLLKGQHPNIVTVREIVVGSNMDKIFIVMDYVEHDMKGLMETMRARKQIFIPGEVKCLMQQLLRAVDHLHDNWILHRDLKTSNLLLSHKGILKVGDFGLAREYGSPLKSYTPVVVTLWYRAPELLLGTKQYSTPIDIWSVGCIFAEFITMHALFPGKSEVDQLNKIFKELGTPNELVWPGWSTLSGARATWADQPGGGLRSRVGSHLSDAGLQLLNGLLTYDPQRRFTANDALCHTYFKEQPMAIDPAMFPTWPAKSEGGRRHQHSPKPPSGGDQYKLLQNEDQAAVGFHMGQPAPATGPFLPPIATGFKLKF